MKWLSALIMMSALALFLVPAGCQSKETSEIEVETNDAEYEIEWEALGSLAASAKRRVECKVTEEIERVGVLVAGHVGEVVEVDASLGESLGHFFAMARASPAVAEFFDITEQ